MDYRDISERIALLTQEIRDLQEKNAEFRKQTEYAQSTNRSVNDTRMLRLMQIKEELSRMMPTRSEHVS
jgi:FtsZ-binding cell division protein ZapB